MLREEFYIYGHPNILATHKTTIEFTKDGKLSKNGDCIVGIKAGKSMPDFSRLFKKKLRNDNTKVLIEIELDDLKEKIKAYGSSKLILKDEKEMVIRKSEFICKRTLCINADKAACNLSRELIERLKNKKKGKIRIGLI